MKSIRRVLFGIAVVLSTTAVSGAEKNTLHTFQKLQLSDQFFSEGAHFGDFNHDGQMDLVSGPYWYAGPKFTERHEYYAPQPFDIAGYSKNFFAFTHDVNRDGWTDIIILGFPGEESWWFANPQGKPGHWQRHVIIKVTDNESPTFVDVTGDGVPEVVCSTGGQLGYAEIPPEDPTQLWKFRPVTPKRDYQRFTHGLGVGDVNGDGRQDMLEKNGWWERSAPDSKDEFWTFHAVNFSEPGGAQMYAFDIDGDGDNDVLTSRFAHGYGLSWFENVPAADKAITFKQHSIMGERPDENEFGVAFSQLHAIELVDMDRDGLADIVTGKRFWAHAEHDPGALEPAVLYWFRTVRENGKVRFIPYRIDTNSGVGTQVVAGDVNGDQWPDIVVGNKKGTFVFLHQTKEVDQRTWQAAQPMPLAVKKPQQAPARPDARKAANRKAAKKNAARKKQAAADNGIAVTAADGRVLNLDFESGDLRDWTATGTAFEGQPVEGDVVHARRPDSVSGHKGKYWITTYGARFDGPQGTLTSVAFPLKHRFVSFLVGGGAGGAMRVEIVRSDSNEVIFSAGGRSMEEMRRVVADLKDHANKEVYVRIVDHGSAGWGHINFDDFRFHDEAPPVAPPASPESDIYPYAGLSGEEAARVMKLPAGFSITLAAAEPDVKQPIAMALDDRGRLWVAEAYEYPLRAPEGKGRDRILIFEDADGDGRFENRKVFAEKLNLVSGLEVGFGGVYVGAAPYLLFIPDRNGDDVPDGKPEVLLDGWAYEDTHETLNTFIWGPDGWLYGCHGVFTHSRVGKPGTPDSNRVPLNAAIWRYHPTQHRFEVFAEGTSNPWGVDFDDNGQAFCTACVIPHLYYVIQGARYQRQAGEHFEPYTYADIQTIADHRHYVGDTPHGGNGRSGDAGGGHAHSGAMIYLGGAWPEEYRHRILMNNIHGQRINSDVLERRGSGFVGRHGADFLKTGDLASQMLNLRYGPDGQVYIIDWYDMNACHHTNLEGHDRVNGRIYKVSYGKTVTPTVDLKKLSDHELVAHTTNKNDWYVRHARRILQERAAAGKLAAQSREMLREMALDNPEPTNQLRAMWALHVTGGLPDELVATLLASPHEYVRAWTIQLALAREKSGLDQLLPRFAALAKSDPSPVVRLYLASAMQRVPADRRWDVLQELVRHHEDAGDHNLPLMVWYAAEPLAEADPGRALAFGLACGKTMPQLREFMLRRIGALPEGKGIAALAQALEQSSDADEQLTIVRGMRSAVTGRRRVKAPPAWTTAFAKVSSSERRELRDEATALGVAFGDQAALRSLRKLITAQDADLTARRDALKTLLAAKDQRLASTLHTLLAEPSLRDAALAGLAMYDDPQTPARILGLYPELSPDEKRAALATLASRGPYALELIKAVTAKQVPAKDLSADLVRQLHNLKIEIIDRTIAETWGQVRATAADKAELIAKYRDLLSKKQEREPDQTLGRAVFVKTCQQCHVLYGAGANIGPDLTGSNRSDLEYLLSNVVDPSAVITKEYRPSVIVTTDGRVITGIITTEDNKAVTIRTATEAIVLPKDEIDERSLSETSMMPDDQLKQFSEEEVVALVAYLRGKSQVPIRATKENSANFFTGRDLAGWQGDLKLWSVENGEIIGRSPGIPHNTFLVSDLAARDFRLTLEVKLVGDAGNSGVQFRSVPLDGFHEMRGYQADIGPGWWGKLYEENGRALLWDKSGEQHVKKGEWNQYEIEAVGGHIRTWINGQPCVDLEDPQGARAGVFALQLHSGGPTEVRFRNVQLEVK